MNKRITNIAMGATFILVVAMAFLFSGCKPKHKVKVYNFPNFVNWNLSLRPEASEDERKQAIAIVSDSILDLKYTPPPVTGRGEKDTTGQGGMTDAQREAQKKLYSKVDSLKVFACPCDPNLVNFTASLIVIDSSGNAVIKPPSNPPPPSFSVPGLKVDTNKKVTPTSAAFDEQSIKKGVRFDKFPSTPADNVILGVLDTGLDTTLFAPSIQGLIWQDATPASTLYNFLPGEDANKLIDDNHAKHGSAATAIALGELTTKSPRIMVLKVLDKHGQGTVFSVSCGLSYARQHNASVINASLGYYGKSDSILSRYFTKEYKTTVLVTAAGNDTASHNAGKLCNSSVNSSNELNASHLFYPACFSNITQDLISVTGMTGNKEGMWPCYYQNYSDVYVTLGVLKIDTTCCTMNVPFLKYPVEGSSFVAPVISGKLANYMITNGFKPTTKQYLKGIGVNNAAPLSKLPPAAKYTVDGQYLPN